MVDSIECLLDEVDILGGPIEESEPTEHLNQTDDRLEHGKLPVVADVLFKLGSPRKTVLPQYDEVGYDCSRAKQAVDTKDGVELE